MEKKVYYRYQVAVTRNGWYLSRPCPLADYATKRSAVERIKKLRAENPFLREKFYIVRYDIRYPGGFRTTYVNGF